MDGLRPLGVGELLDAAIKIYAARWRTLLAAVAVPVVPVVVLSAMVTWSAQPGTSIDPLTGTPNFDGGDLAVTLAATLVSTVALLIASSIATAACFRSISGAYLGDDPQWRASLRFGMRRALPVLGASLLTTLAMFAGFVVVGLGVLASLLTLVVTIPLAIAVAVWAYAALAMTIPALLVEDLGVIGSLRRSARLVRGTFWRVFGIVALGTILATVFQSIISLPLVGILVVDVSPIVEQIVNVVVQSIAVVAVTPFTAALTMALYVDLRVRKEGFDLVLLAQRLGADPSGGFPRQPGAPPTFVPPPGYGYPQPGYAPPGSGYPPPGYPPPGYPPPGYAPPGSGHPQPGYPQPGYPQPGATAPTAPAAPPVVGGGAPAWPPPAPAPAPAPPASEPPAPEA